MCTKLYYHKKLTVFKGPFARQGGWHRQVTGGLPPIEFCIGVIINPYRNEKNNPSVTASRDTSLCSKEALKSRRSTKRYENEQ